MSCMHETGPLIFFFIDKSEDIHVSTNHIDWKCSCVKTFGPKALTTPLDRLFLEGETFFLFSAHAEDVDCKGCICL